MTRGTSPDLILTGARLWTGASGPPGAAVPESAVAVRKGRVLALGAAADVGNLRGPDTSVLDLEGRFLGPGFVDAHVHLLAGGLARSRVDLGGCRSPDELLGRIGAAAREAPEGAWILGGDWNEGDWKGEAPTRHWLDQAAEGRPVFLFRSDLHTGVASSRALELAGIDAEPQDPDGGVVERDPGTGEPTGILRERAVPLVTGIVPPPTEAERRAALLRACREALAGGITQVHDMGSVHRRDESWESFRDLQGLRAGGELPLRVYAALPLADHAEVAALVAEEGRGDDRLAWGMVKGFVDGSLGSSTAWFHEPYSDDPTNRGAPITDLDDLRDQVRGALDEGLHVAVHAIGDRAVDWIFSLRDEAGDRTPAHPFRVEHVQHLSETGLARCARPGTILSVQPLHLVTDAGSTPLKLGAERETRSLAFRSMEARGARLAFGSDWPVVPLEPIRTLQAAVTRRPGSSEPWLPDERLSADSAFRAHTAGAARAGLLGKETGSVRVGDRADFVVLSRDPFRTDPDVWDRELRVEMTFVDGAPVYRADDARPAALGGRAK